MVIFNSIMAEKYHPSEKRINSPWTHTGPREQGAYNSQEVDSLGDSYYDDKTSNGTANHQPTGHRSSKDYYREADKQKRYRHPKDRSLPPLHGQHSEHSPQSSFWDREDCSRSPGRRQRDMDGNRTQKIATTVESATPTLEPSQTWIATVHGAQTSHQPATIRLWTMNTGTTLQ